MRITKTLSVLAASVALLTTPTLAASAPVADARTAAVSDEESDLFGNRRGGILALILIAVVIAIGIYIVVDDEEDEEPASP